MPLAADSVTAIDEGDGKKESSLPSNNTAYGKQEYWEERFETETEFEWLVSYRDVADMIRPCIASTSEILVVGCGNSSFSADLYDDGYPHITNVDYSANVIARMAHRHSTSRPLMKWRVVDMTDMSAFGDASFDCVIDKAAMDALMVNEGDVWNPSNDVRRMTTKMCSHISRVLRASSADDDDDSKRGYHLHISFAQPHFRKKYLLGTHGFDGEGDDAGSPPGDVSISNNGHEYSNKFGWDYKVEAIGGDSGCFHHFLYIMQK